MEGGASRTQTRCSPVQERWYRLREAHPYAHSTRPFRGADDWILRGRLETAVLAASLDAVVDRQWALRTAFSRDGDRIVQAVRERSVAEKLEVHDLSQAADGDDRMDEIVCDLYTRPLDVEAGRVFRAGLIRLGPQCHRLIFSWDHLVFDGVSSGILRRELLGLHAAWLADAGADADDVLGKLSHHYVDWADDQWRLLAGDIGSQLKAHWAQRLEGAPDLVLPAGEPAPAEFGPSFDLRGELSAEIMSAIDRLASEEQASRATILLALLFALLHRTSGQTDLCVVLPADARRRREFSRVVGYFTIPLIIRVQLEPTMTFRALCRTTLDALLDADDWRVAPVYAVLPVPPGVRRLGFNYQSWTPARTPVGLDVELNRSRPSLAPYNDMPLLLRVFEAGASGPVRFLLSARQDLSRAQVAQLVPGLCRLGGILLCDPDQPLR